MPLAMNMNPFITCAVTGSGGTQERSPHVPRSPEQIAASALDAARAGAAVVLLALILATPATWKRRRNAFLVCLASLCVLIAVRILVLMEYAAREVPLAGERSMDQLHPAVASLLQSLKFFLGDEPSSIDAVVFGFLGVSAYVEGDNPLFNHAASLENLFAYCERMRARYFPETIERAKSA